MTPASTARVKRIKLCLGEAFLNQSFLSSFSLLGNAINNG
jgi:hypothetical protein